MMGRHLLALDAEQDLLEAFASFDDGDKGWVKVDEVRKALREMGDRMDEREASHESTLKSLYGLTVRSTDYLLDHSQTDKAVSIMLNGQRYYE